MHCAYRVGKILSTESPESQGWTTVGLDDRETSCPEHGDAGDRYLSDRITRAEVMEYLSHTYGAQCLSRIWSNISHKRVMQGIATAHWPGSAGHHFGNERWATGLPVDR